MSSTPPLSSRRHAFASVKRDGHSALTADNNLSSDLRCESSGLWLLGYRSRQSRIYRVGPRAIDPKHDRSNRVPSASKARKKEATPNGSLSPTNHWQEPTRLEIDASSNSQRRETVDDRRSYHNRRACVSGGVFSDYATLHF